MSDKVCMITVNYNQNEYTIKCVESLRKSEYNNYSILVIDNGPTEENHHELQNALPIDDRIILHRLEENRGYVGGINYGLEEGAKLNADYFLILNNDTLIDKKAVTELVKTCKDYNDKAIVTGKVFHYNEPNKLQYIGCIFKNKRILTYERIGQNEIDTGQYNTVKERNMIDDIFWLFPSHLYRIIGGYSPYFWFNAEQADYALRAQKVNYKLVFTPNAKLWHKGSVSIGGKEKNPKLVYWSIQSSLIMRYLHLNKINFILYLFETLNSISRTSVKSAVLLLRGDKSLLNYAAAKRKGFMYFLKWLVKKNKNIGANPF